MSYTRLHLLAVLALLTSLAACNSASPKMNVLGMRAPRLQSYQRQSMELFVEVHNPGDKALDLRRVEYRLVAKGWIDSEGELEVRRVIRAGSSAIVELRVPVNEIPAQIGDLDNVPYELQARLEAVQNKSKRSFAVSTSGALQSSAAGGQLRLHPIRVAGAK
jgi:hypothetical protein